MVPRDESFYAMFNEAAENASLCANELRARMSDLPNGLDGAQRVVEARLFDWDTETRAWVEIAVFAGAEA